MESGLKTTVLFQSNQLAPFVDLDTRWSIAVQTLNIALFAKCFYCNFAMELLDGLRKRNVGGNKEHLTEKKEEKEKRKVDLGAVDDVEPGTYWFTRIVFLRALAFVYFVAFAVAANQNKQLLGKNGLLPSDTYLRRVEEHFEGDVSWRTFLHFPTLLLYGDKDKIDWHLDLLADAGLALSGFVLLCGCANMIIMIILWVLYHSIVNIGQRWYSFGWESQLLETGFLAVFLCPTIKLNLVPIHTPTPLVVVWGYRWLIFRIMIGAGLIKLRGDQCWRDLTCMNYHYETQPVPNPMSYYMHQSPEYFHKFETLTNHFIELVVPFFILLTRPFRNCCGILQILFQVTLIVSGNLSFLNWLTVLPSLMCFDDKALAFLFSSSSSAKREVIRIQQLAKTGMGLKPSWGLCVRRVFEIMLGLLIAYLSVPVVQNLLSSRQAMNTSFDSFRLVNTYGAFGSVTKERTEVLFQGTRNSSIIPDDKGGIWQEYEFNCKPGDPKRRPCLISPYHYRLDWLMWFAAFQNYQYNPWLIHLAAKLLANDEQATSLMAHNPFINGTPPKFIRGEHYRYEFTKLGSREAREGYWWKRTKIGTYFPPVSLQGLKNYLQSHGWKVPKLEKKS